MNKRYGIVLYVLLISILFISCGKNSERTLIGSYYKSIDETDYVASRAKEYLSDAWLSEELDMDMYFNNISVSVNVLLYSDDTYEEVMDEDSYELAKQISYEQLEKALCDLIVLRMEAAGRTNIDSDSVNDIMIEKLGMTAKDYIAKYGPELMPDREKLESDISVSGSFALPKETK